MHLINAIYKIRVNLMYLNFLINVDLNLRWFLSFALRIPTAHDFCIISARKLARARTQQKKFPSS